MDPFEAPRSVPMWDADRVVPRARQWIEKVSSGRAPFFVWLHLFDPHIPYAPPEAWRPAGPLAEELPEVAWEDLTAMAGRNGGALSREVLERAEGLYAGEIAFTDHWLGELLEAMRRQGLLDSTVIVLTADHGECFENGVYFEHSECMYDGAIRVPLIIRYPARIAPGRREEQVENLDIAPTILALAGIPAPQEFRGRSLLVAMSPGEGAALLQHPLYQQDTTDNRRRMLEQIRTVAGQPVRPLLSGRDEVGVRTPGWKYLVAGADRELYDLRADPRESANLAAAQPERAAQLDARVREWVRAHPMRIVDDSKINEELRETLRSLGYVQ